MRETPNMLDQLLMIAVNSSEVLMLINFNIINILLLLLNLLSPSMGVTWKVDHCLKTPFMNISYDSLSVLPTYVVPKILSHLKYSQNLN